MSLFQIFKGTLTFLVALAFAYILVLTINVWIGLLTAILIASALRPAILRLITVAYSARDSHFNRLRGTCSIHDYAAVDCVASRR